MVGGSGGIGRGVALSLARMGADIYLLGGRSSERMEAVLAELRLNGVAAEGRLLNWADETEAFALLTELGEVEGAGQGESERAGLHSGFDILVIAFGPFLQKPLAETSAADWRRMAELNLALPGALASWLLPGMARQRWGRMVFFGGTGTDTIKGFATNAAYAAAKTGLGVLAKSISLSYADEGIAAFVVCPGLVDTEYLDDRRRAALSEKAPAGRLIAVDHIADTIAAFVASDPCLVSGSVISLDAGLAFARR